MITSPKILYIDDEEDLVMLAQSFFEDEELQLDISTDFDHALELIRTNEYDIVITDAKLPKGSGQELLTQVRNDGKFRGKFILVTGNIESPEIIAKLGFDLVLHKPIHFQELVKQVKQLLAEPTRIQAK